MTENNKHETDEAFAILMDLVNDAFNTHYSKESPMDSERKSAPKEEHSTIIYESIEDYTAKTGKRFRMTKNQKELGMTREEAFRLTFGEY